MTLGKQVLLAVSVVILSVVLWFLASGFVRHREYTDLLSHSGLRARLNAEVASLECAETETDLHDFSSLSLGYLKFKIPDSVVTAESSKNWVVVKLTAGKYVFLEPTTSVDDSEILGSGGYFEKLKEVAETGPKSFLELALLPEREYQDYKERLILKCGHMFYDRGIRFFENDRLKAIVGLGLATRPEERHCLVFDKATGISQGVYVTSEDSFRINVYTCTLLNSYELTVASVPDASALESMILAALSNVERRGRGADEGQN